jgi:arsenical pump membrane protein
MPFVNVVHVLTFGVLIATVVLVIWPPRPLNEGIVALLGAACVLVLGTATFADVWRAISDTAGILVFLVAMMVVAVIAEEAGCFDWAAHRAVTLSRGHGRLLFLNLYLLGALVTIFLSLDVTAIMIAPIVCALLRRSRLSPLPFVLGCAYVANTASLFLPMSNLTNMLVYSLLQVPFWAFVRLMTLPNLAAMLVNLLVFFARFRRQIPSRLIAVDDDAQSPVPASKDRSNLGLTALGLALVVGALLLAGALGLPLYLPALVGALVMGGAAVAAGRVRPRRLAAGIAWPLPLFVVGMYTVVVATNRVGLAAPWQALLTFAGSPPSLVGLIAVAFGTALGANLVNNLPMSLVAITGLGRIGNSGGTALAFASLIGTNVGPNVTIFGSLATMLVLQAARRNGIRVSPIDYLMVGLLTTPLMLLAATLTLWLLVRG